MANNTAFETSDQVVLKGKVSGVKQMSKKMKLIFLFMGLVFMLFLIFSIFTLDGASPTDDKALAEQQEAADKAKSATMEPAKADVVTKGVGDGNAAIANESPVFDLSTISPLGTSVPLVPLKAGGSGSASTASIILPAGSVPSPSVKVSSAQANASAVLVPAPSAATVLAVTPAEMAAKRTAEVREQQRTQALSGEVEVAGGWGGAKPSAGAGAQVLASLQGGAPTGGGYPAPRLQEQDDQNKQVHKESFLREAEAKTGGQYYLKETRQAAISKYEIKMGWKIPAMLIDGLNSDLPGQVCAQVRENVYDTATGKYLLIPQGAKVCGTYDSHVAVGQERFLMAWNRIMFDDGSALTLGGMPGADQAGYAGFDAEVDNHYFKVFTSAIMMSVISAGMQLSQPQQGGSNAAPNATQTAAAAIGQQIGQVSSALVQQNLKIQPTLKQQPGYRFNIQITRDVIFPGPYVRRQS